MTSIWLPALVALAAITAVYLSCVRPHLRRRGCLPTQTRKDTAGLDQQVTDLREQLRVLRVDAHVSDRELPRNSTPPVV